MNNKFFSFLYAYRLNTKSTFAIKYYVTKTDKKADNDISYNGILTVLYDVILRVIVFFLHTSIRKYNVYLRLISCMDELLNAIQNCNGVIVSSATIKV